MRKLFLEFLSRVADETIDTLLSVAFYLLSPEYREMMKKKRKGEKHDDQT